MGHWPYSCASCSLPAAACWVLHRVLCSCGGWDSGRVSIDVRTYSQCTNQNLSFFKQNKDTHQWDTNTFLTALFSPLKLLSLSSIFDYHVGQKNPQCYPFGTQDGKGTPGVFKSKSPATACNQITGTYHPFHTLIKVCPWNLDVCSQILIWKPFQNFIPLMVGSFFWFQPKFIHSKLRPICLCANIVFWLQSFFPNQEFTPLMNW